MLITSHSQPATYHDHTIQNVRSTIRIRFGLLDVSTAARIIDVGVLHEILGKTWLAGKESQR